MSSATSIPPDAFGNTPLHKAISSPLARGDLDVLQALLTAGASRNARNVDGDTLIHLAIRSSKMARPNNEGGDNGTARG